MTQVHPSPAADELPYRRLSNRHAQQMLQRTEIIWSQPGVARRTKLLAFLRENATGLEVNRRHQIRDTDPDIRTLLKKGDVRRVREHSPHGRSGQTYIRITPTAE